MQVEEYKAKRVESKQIDCNKVKRDFEEKGYTLLAKQCLTVRSELDFICNKHIDGGVQTTTYRNLKRVVNSCKYCQSEFKRELFQHNIEYVKTIFEDHGMELLEDTYVNSTVKMAYKCKEHPNEVQYISLTHLLRDQACRICSRIKRSGENHWNWKGGVSNLSVYVRSFIGEWKNLSVKNSKYKCVITQKRFDSIHHLYSFNAMMKEMLEELQINEYEDITKYTDEQLISIINKIIEIHKRYPLGVCLKKELHLLFHQEYGYGDNMPEQFEDFKFRLKEGDFDDFLKENNLKLAI